MFSCLPQIVVYICVMLMEDMVTYVESNQYELVYCIF